MASPGVKLHGAGFIVSPARARALGLGTVPGLEAHIRPYRNGRDLTQRSRDAMVIDLFGLTEPQLRQRFGAVWQHVHETVKPQRDAIADNGPDAAQYAEEWWLFGKPRPELRAALRGLSRFIATVETAKHRPFVFLDANVIPDNMLIAIGSDDAFHLGVLSSKQHVARSLEAGGTLEDRPRYNKTQAFDPFPFPDPPPGLRAEIAAIAEELDTHRKDRFAAHAHLTLTGLYNALEAYRAGHPLSDAERDTHEAGRIAILALLHDRLDAAVACAYGWPEHEDAKATTARIVALNAERVAEEAAGKIRWLRPAFQAPLARVQTALATGAEAALAAAAAAWPKNDEAAQYVALRQALRAGPATPRDLATRLIGAPKRGDRLPKMLATLVALGQARELTPDRFTA